MTTKAEIQLVKKLSQKKYRAIEQKFVVEGKRLISEGLKSNFTCIKIFVTKEFLDRDSVFKEFLYSPNKKLDVITKRDFLKISSTKNPQGIAAVFSIPDSKECNYDKTIIYLDNISDPGNLGTIIRSCEWFGIKTICLSKECADLYNPKVLRASMGAVFYLNIIEDVSVSEIIPKVRAKNYKTLFADMNGIDYKSIDYSGKLFIAFCNEAFGPSKDLIENCDSAITIPKIGNVDSLNVAAAAAVILSQIN